MLEWVSHPGAWLALGTLAILEILLGIDNVIFLTLVLSKLPLSQRQSARQIGLASAMLVRLGLLFTITCLIDLVEPLLTVWGHIFSARDLILFAYECFRDIRSNRKS